MYWRLQIKGVPDVEYFETREAAMQSLHELAKEWRACCPEYEFLCTGIDRDEEIEASGIEYDLTAKTVDPKPRRPVRPASPEGDPNADASQ
jgi:hypothetical protein